MLVCPPRTELYMLQDSSAGYEDTWDFMDRRLAGFIELESKVGTPRD